MLSHLKQPGQPLLACGVVLLLLGALCCVGCGKPAASVLGVPPTAPANTTVAQLPHLTPAHAVTLQGEMIQKCPVAGCWFMLRDKTGVARIDTKAAGFVVSNVPLHTTVTVVGTATPGNEPGLAATGLRY